MQKTSYYARFILIKMTVHQHSVVLQTVVEIKSFKLWIDKFIITSLNSLFIWILKFNMLILLRLLAACKNYLRTFQGNFHHEFENPSLTGYALVSFMVLFIVPVFTAISVDFFFSYMLKTLTIIQFEVCYNLKK